MIRQEQEAFIFGTIFLLANRLQVWGDRILPEITTKQLFLLIFISNMEVETPTIKDIASFTGTSRQNTKKLLEQLESKGFVSLHKSPTDARAIIVSFTAKTTQYFKEQDQFSTEQLALLFQGVTEEELECTMNVIHKLLAYLD